MRSSALVLVVLVLACGEGPADPPGQRDLAGRIVFVSTRDQTAQNYVQALYEMSADGAEQTPLIQFDSLVVSDPEWAPDGERIVFSGEDLPSNEVALYVVDGDGSNLIRLSGVDALDPQHPTWSPDGGRIAFYSRAERTLWVANADGSDPVELLGGQATEPAWSPDGTEIAFVNRDSGQEIYAMDADGSNLRNLTENPAAAESSPAWSPDGSMIAFEQDSQIFVMNADGSSPRQLTEGGTRNEDPSWSPDGSNIAFSSDLAGLPNDLWIIRSDGTDPVQVTQSGFNYDPSWRW